MTVDEVAKDIVDAALKLHRALGPGSWHRLIRSCMLFSWRAWRPWRFVLPGKGEETFINFALMGDATPVKVFSALSG